jgi:pyruvate/2-oxoglutarate dehydrogenase complex dihydrolipoamide acyltransferase (E2) component
MDMEENNPVQEFFGVLSGAVESEERKPPPSPVQSNPPENQENQESIPPPSVSSGSAKPAFGWEPLIVPGLISLILCAAAGVLLFALPLNRQGVSRPAAAVPAHPGTARKMSARPPAARPVKPSRVASHQAAPQASRPAAANPSGSRASGKTAARKPAPPPARPSAAPAYHTATREFLLAERKRLGERWAQNKWNEEPLIDLIEVCLRLPDPKTADQAMKAWQRIRQQQRKAAKVAR